MTNHAFRNIVVVLGLLLGSAGAIAAEVDSNEGHAAEEEHGKHELALFTGITREDDESLGTFGIEYSYHINSAWSVGGVVERADRDKDSTLAIVFAHWWPYERLFIGAGVGRKDPAGERENTFRAAIGYEFEIGGGWSITPQANLDIIEGHENEEVYGIAFGKRF